jgi:hypothetical protein
MIKLISEVVSRLTGKVTVHAKASNIKGNKSSGTRDLSKVDWRQ